MTDFQPTAPDLQGAGAIGDSLSYVYSIEGTRHPQVQRVSVTLSQTRPNGPEMVVLKMAGQVLGERHSLAEKIQTLLQPPPAESPRVVDNLVTALTTWAHERNISPQAAIRDLSAEVSPLESLSLGLSFTTPQDPHTVRDRLTQLRTKATLYSSAGLADVAEHIPGPKILVGFDVRGVSEANRVGLGQSGVDALFSGLSELARKEFGDIPFEMFRLGGDEFAIVVEARGDKASISLAAIERFRIAAMKRREELVPLESKLAAEAEYRLEIRTRMRAIFAECSAPSANFHKEYLLHLINEYGDRLNPSAFRACLDTRNGEFDAGKLTLLAALSDTANSAFPRQRQVLNFIGAAICISERPSADEISQALASIDQQVHRLKESSGDGRFLLLEPTPYIKVRAASKNLIQSVEGANEALNKARQVLADGETLTSIEQVHAIIHQNNQNAMDPEIGPAARVLRLGLLMETSIRHILPITEPRDYSWFEVRLEPFGPLNNQLGSDRADEIFRVMARNLRALYPDALFVRRNGGNLVILTPAADSPIDLRKIEHTINQTICSASGHYYERATVEHEIRQALRRFISAREEPADLPDAPDGTSRSNLSDERALAETIVAEHQELPIRMEMVSEPQKIILSPNESFRALFEKMLPNESSPH